VRDERLRSRGGHDDRLRERRSRGMVGVGRRYGRERVRLGRLARGGCVTVGRCGRRRAAVCGLTAALKVDLVAEEGHEGEDGREGEGGSEGGERVDIP
jgi:hypothetical protein